uniref:Uncharacterized protein n=1 Tax=Arundo donax TaxID=35708 RepID=A0A0A9H454_ARUDO
MEMRWGTRMRTHISPPYWRRRRRSAASCGQVSVRVRRELGFRLEYGGGSGETRIPTSGELVGHTW